MSSFDLMVLVPHRLCCQITHCNIAEFEEIVVLQYDIYYQVLSNKIYSIGKFK